ncbi:MAG: hypothetical protein K9M57_04105 [Phycisphaerae bacterium]|nr:hypothetical protein [Phycisphaerae bacterium]
MDNISNKKIVVVLPGPMGDVVMGTGALHRLRAGLPGCAITFMGSASARAILAGCPWADDWIGVDNKSEAARALRGGKFDAAILMRNSFRSAWQVWRAGIAERIGYDRDGRGCLLTHRVNVLRIGKRFAPIAMKDYYGRLVDEAIERLGGDTAVDTADQMELFVGDEDRREVDALLERWKLRDQQDKLVMLVVGGAFGGSKWWPADRFGQLADRLSDDGYRVIVSCAPNDTERQIDRAVSQAASSQLYHTVNENVSLGGIKELTRRCALMVSNDTGPCHIAAAFNVRLVTLFGPTDPRWTVTEYTGEVRLRCDVVCGPCQESVCQKDHRCMAALSVDRVYDAAVAQLAATRPEEATPGHGPAGTYYRVYDESFVPLRDASGLVHSTYKPLLENHELGSLNDIFSYSQGERLHKAGLGVRERFRLKLKGPDGQGCTVYLKRFGRDRLKSLVKQWLSRRSMDAAGMYDFAAAVDLARAGVPVPRPIAYGQEIGPFGEKRSFAIIEELPNAEALERLMPQWAQVKGNYKLLANRRALIGQVAALARTMHDQGYYHRDFYLAHLFLCRDKFGQEKICLIDLQRVFKPIIARRRWQIKDLSQLYYSAKDYFSKTEMARFLRTYFDVAKLTPEHKLLIRAVVAKAKRIERHDRKKLRTQN